jgi:hypothetical protein
LSRVRHREYFYRCWPEYLDLIDEQLRDEVLGVVAMVRPQRTQAEVNQDLTWLFALRGWVFSSFPPVMPHTPPADLGIADVSKESLTKSRSLSRCLISATLEHRWIAAFVKQFGAHCVHAELQFGNKEAAVMDPAKLQIAYYERHLSVGVVMVMLDPDRHFAHRHRSVAGMAKFHAIRELLPVLGLECPMLLIGIGGSVARQTSVLGSGGTRLPN